jgi:hypothetical protein
MRKGDSLFWAKDYLNSAQNYSSAFKSLGWKAMPDDRYKAACSYAMANIPDSAFHHLERLIVNANFKEYDRVAKDQYLKPLHKDKRWLTCLEKIEQNILPEGCFRAGSKAQSYHMFIAHGAGREGQDVFTIKSKDKDIDGYGTLMQNSLPPEFLGEKIRLTGYMKSENVEGWAGFWLNVEQPDKKAPRAYDNMHNRPIKGTTAWKKYEIVLYVSPNATNISFGGLLHGTGQIWFEKIELEVVGRSVRTTAGEK